MFDWLLKRIPKKPSDGTGADMFADAYTRPSETADRWTVAARADMLVARLSGAFDIAINGNATDAAATKMRLYERTTKSNAKRVTGKRLDFLRGKLDHRPDAKTVSFVEDAGELVEITDGPVIDFLHQPNPWMTGAEWSFLRFKAREATGNAYSWFYGNGKIVEAYFLAPQCVRVVAEDGNPIALYRFSRNMTDWLEMQPEQVFHTKLRPSLQDFRLGDTWVHGILKHLDAQEAALDSELARQRNMQRPDYAAVVKGNSTPTQREEVRKVLRNDFRGPAQAGKAAVLGGDIEIIPLGWAPKDLENQELFRYIDQIIDRAAGRPESLSKLNDASRANAGTGLIQYMRNTIQPRQSKDAVELTDYLLPIFGLEPGRYFFAYDDCVPEDEAAKTTLRIQKAAAGLITWDEARAEDGMEPYAKGLGDVPRVNGVPAQTQQQLDEQRQAQADAIAESNADNEDPKSEKKKYGAKALAPLPPEVERQVSGLRPKVADALRNVAENAPMNADGSPDLTEFKRELSKALEEDRRERFWRDVAAVIVLLLLKAGVDAEEARRRSDLIVKQERASVDDNLWLKYNDFAVERIAATTAQNWLRVREEALRRLEAEAMREAQNAAEAGTGVSGDAGRFRVNPDGSVSIAPGAGSGGVAIPPAGGGGSGGGGSGGVPGGSGGPKPMPTYRPELLDRLGPNPTPAEVRAVAAEQEAWDSILDDVAPRANRIAEHETYAVNNLGRLAASDLAAYRWLEWFTYEDEKVCIQCNGMVARLSRASLLNPEVPKELRGKPVQRVDVTFTEDGEEFGSINEVVGPPLHVGCRCTIEATATEYKLSIEDTAESATRRFGSNKTRLFRMFEKLYKEQLEQYRRERDNWRNRQSDN